MEFKKLELDSDIHPFKRLIKSPNFKRSLVTTLIGAVGATLYFYLTEGRHMDVITFGQIVKSFAIGGAFGYFIANSPCARGRC